MQTMCANQAGLWRRSLEWELNISPGAGAKAPIKNQKEPELSLKFRTSAGAMAI